MSKREYLKWSLDQRYLLPPSLHDWLPENHAVYRFLELVNQLDISEITERDQEKDRQEDDQGCLGPTEDELPD